MAVYFNLMCRATGKDTSKVKIDNDMCAALGVEPDSVNFYKNWVNTIGFSMACGVRPDAIREMWGKNKGDALDYLETYYSVDSGHCR